MRGVNAGAQFVCQFALLFNRGKDGSPALIQRTQADEFVGDDADLFIVKRARHLLAITGDEGDSIVIIQKVDDRSDLRRFDIELGGNLFGVGHAGDSIMSNT